MTKAKIYHQNKLSQYKKELEDAKLKLEWLKSQIQEQQEIINRVGDKDINPKCENCCYRGHCQNIPKHWSVLPGCCTQPNCKDKTKCENKCILWMY